jgi:hypothetical protein
MASNVSRSAGVAFAGVTPTDHLTVTQTKSSGGVIAWASNVCHFSAVAVAPN